METVSLVKGERIDLAKVAPGATKFLVGLGWDPQSDGSQDFDLDATVYLLKNGKVVKGAKDMIYFGNKISECGAVTHNGDNLTGVGAGDDETVLIDTAKLDVNLYDEVQFAVAIFMGNERNQTFGQVDDAYIRILEGDQNGTQLCKFDLTEDYSGKTAVVAGKLYYKDGSWRFQAVGTGYANGFKDLCNNAGLAC